uniref:Uncharacterized protein n=1 Tax=Ascaris lumbricoides TaxID=6252 RepID=A0A0M3I9G3_ASCLU
MMIRDEREEGDFVFSFVTSLFVENFSVKVSLRYNIN